MVGTQLVIDFQAITINCDHCKKPIGLSLRNENLFEGFLDADNSMFVCWSCKAEYYRWKKGEGVGTTYSEMPATVQTLSMAKKQIHGI